MSRPSKLRRRIAHQAARLILLHKESSFATARAVAARRVAEGWVRPRDLPTLEEIQAEVEALHCADASVMAVSRLKELRLLALHWLERLAAFSPRLTGDVWHGRIHQNSVVEIIAQVDRIVEVSGLLDQQDVPHDQVSLPVFRGSQVNPIELIRLSGPEVVEISAGSRPLPFSSTATAMQLRNLLQAEYSDNLLEESPGPTASHGSRFEMYRQLLLPLEQITRNPNEYPESDVLYHSLQVFELAFDQRPYDEELLLAAILHEVGQAIDSLNPVQSGLAALSGLITGRTGWLIEQLPVCHQAWQQSLGARARKRLEQNENFADLRLLAEWDRAGHCQGARTRSLEAALEQIQSLAQQDA